ncbi:hypothetical protein VHN57_20430 [Sphingobium sp. WW5]|uniref:hypothetical protein n=1 Tax=unclassified Sphingobium TaxID=2611147 RepID=UPI003C2048D8
MRNISPHAPRSAIRNILRNFKRLNEIENADVNIEQLIKAMRADLQKTNTELSDTEIERRISRRLDRGMRPTTAVPLAHPIPTKKRCGKPRQNMGGKR